MPPVSTEPEAAEAVPRISDAGADALRGTVRWVPARSIWIGGATLATLLLGPFYVTPGAVTLFLLTSAVTLCFGHSVGMHRRLIHGSFECPLWLEHVCVYLGTLVGMCGPMGMVRTHDLRDWAQRQRACHDYFCHGSSLWRDAWWQLHCELRLRAPPVFRPEPRLAGSRFYVWLERTWMAQQIPWVVLFYYLGGPGWVIWGICARVCVCVTGHWLVGYYAHNRGTQKWLVAGAAAQGYNVRLAALLSMGEGWHNNHHAFPESARLGLGPGEPDPGWWLICGFRRLGLAWNVRTPADLPPRPRLRPLAGPGTGTAKATS